MAPAKEGAYAFQRGAKPMSCPYIWPGASKKAEQWEAGYFKAKAEHEKLRLAVIKR